MDFKSRFQGRSGFINKQGNIIDEGNQQTFPLQKSPNFQGEQLKKQVNFTPVKDQQTLQPQTDSNSKTINKYNSLQQSSKQLPLNNNQSEIQTNSLEKSPLKKRISGRKNSTETSNINQAVTANFNLNTKYQQVNLQDGSGVQSIPVREKKEDQTQKQKQEEQNSPQNSTSKTIGSQVNFENNSNLNNSKVRQNEQGYYQFGVVISLPECKQNVTIINNQSTIITNNQNNDKGSQKPVNNRHRKYNSLGDSIDYINKTMGSSNEYSNSQGQRLDNGLSYQQNEMLESTVVYDSQSANNSPLKIKNKLDQSLSQQAQKLIGKFNNEKQLVVGTLHLNKSKVTSQRTSVDQLQHLKTNEFMDNRDSLIGSPLSDKTFKSQPINYDSFYHRFSEFKTKLTGQSQIMPYKDKMNQGINETALNKTANFGEGANRSKDSTLPSIYKNNKIESAKQIPTKPKFSAPNPLQNTNQRYSSDQKIIMGSSGAQSQQIRSSVNQSEVESNNSFNQTFAPARKSRSKTKAMANLKTIQVDNRQELDKLKQQAENVRNIANNRKNYQAYNLNDYLQLQNVYDQSYKRLGGLGPNIGTDDWQNKKVRIEKANQYAQSIKTIPQL